MSWRLENKLLLFIIIICIILTFSVQIKAQKLSLKQAIKRGVSHNSTLRSLDYDVNNLKRKLSKLKAKMSWQLDLTGETNYKRKTVENLNNLGKIEENTERRKEFVFNLHGERLFGWGLKFNPTVSLNQDKLESDSFEFDNLDDKLEADVTLTQKIYPWVPSELRQEYYSVQVDLQRAKNELKWQQQQKKIDWLASYLNLLRLQEQKKLANNNYNLAKQNLLRVKHQQKINEAGKQKLLLAKIRLKEAKVALVKAENKFKQTKRNWLQELGYNKAQEIIITANNSYLQAIKKRVKNLDIKEKNILNKVPQVYPDSKYKQQKKELITKQLKWKQSADKPKFDLTGNYDYQSKDWEVGINLEYNLFDSGYQRLIEKDYYQQLIKLEEDYKNLVRNLEVKVNNLFDQLFQARLQLNEKKVILGKVKLETKLFKKQLRAGGISKDKFKQKRNEFKRAKIDVRIKKDNILINKLNLIKFSDNSNSL